MAGNAPPAADTKKPATPPPAAKNGPQAGGAAKAPAAPQAGAGAKPAGAASSQQTLDRLAVRAKLAVSEPGDAVEREADAVADKVMRMPEPAGKQGGGAQAEAKPAATPAAAAATGQKVSRLADPAAAAAGASADKPADQTADKATQAAAKPSSPAVNTGHPRPASTEGTHGGLATSAGKAAPDIAREVAPGAEKDAAGRLSVPTDFASKLGSGEPLDASTRAFFEQRVGQDLSSVRVHTDANAQQAATQIGAKAFTFGHHIAFAGAQYEPGTAQGKALLAHELAHVLQQQHSVSRAIMRQPAGTAPAGGSSNDIALKGVEIPAFKFGYYQGEYRRPANYRRSEKGSKQKTHWNTATKTARDGFPGAYGLKEGSVYVAVPKKSALDVGNADLLVGEPKAIGELVARPKWKKDGTPNPHDIDHKIELQIGGPGQDNADNLELRDSKANQDSGRNIDASITSKLKDVKDKENGDPEKIRANPAYTFVFSDFKNAGGSTSSSVWIKEDINKLEAAEGLNIYDPDAAADTGKVKAWPTGVDKENFFGGPDTLVIYPSRRGGKPQKIKLGADKKPKGGSQLPKDWIPGFEISSFDLSPGAGDQMGSLSVKFSIKQFPNGYELPVIPIRKLSGSLTQAGFVSTDGIRNKISQLLSAKTPVPQASPVDIEEVDVMPGTGLVITGTITPSVQILNSPIDFSVTGSSFELSKTFTNDELKVPGPFKVTGSSLTVALNSGSGFGVTGIVGFEIPKLGEGTLVGKGAMNSFSIAGDFTFDRKLFDAKATLKASYTKQGEAGHFAGEADLEIGKDKIKGVKKASAHAVIDNEAFSITGKADIDIPGLKKTSLGISYDKDTLQVTGELGIDEGVPGVKSASVNVTVTQSDAGWKLGAKGTVIPNLPGLKGSTLTFSYDDGAVLAEGDFDINQGPLSGKFKAGVTNATVDAAGKPVGKGAGSHFSVYGAAEIDAVFIPDKLKGKLKLRLLTDGSIRVGGGLVVPDFDLFPRIPQGDPNFVNESFTTPEVPIPGLGFSVGSISVGVTLSATVGFKAFASLGPGQMRNISVTVKEFNPADVDLDALEIGGGATFAVPGNAGASVSAGLNLNFSAAVAKLTGTVGLEAKVEIPPEEQPILSADSRFTYSQKKGLDIHNTLSLGINPALKFKLFGEVKAQLNLLVSTVTVWSKDWTLAESSYKLPVSINAKGELGYNSKTGKTTPASVKDAFQIKQPDLNANTIQAIAMDKPSPPVVETTDKKGQPLDDAAMSCMPAAEPNQSVMPNASFPSGPNQSVMPKREGGAASNRQDQPAQQAVDDGVFNSLGQGQPLDEATRGYFEQRMKADLSGVRIHTSPDAATEAERISARAFTVGQDIAFAKGAYQPDSVEGRELLAHELAHVLQQQGDAARAVMRAPDAAAPAPDEDTPTTPPAVINLGMLKLPQFKANVQHRQDLYQAKVGASALFRPASFDRGDTAQSATWMSRVSAAGALGRINTRLGTAVQPSQPYLIVPKRARTRGIVVGTPAEIADNVKRPLWNRDGHFQTFHVDHIVELQVNGEDNIDNMELLAAGPNQASGRDIRSHLEADITTWKAAHPEEARTVARIKRYYKINFSGVNGAYAPADADYWRKAEIDRGDQLDFDNTVNILDPQAPRRGAPFSTWPAGLNPHDFTGSATRVVLYPRQSGGMPRGIDWPADQEGHTRAVNIRDWIEGFHIISVQFNTAGTEPQAGFLRGTLFANNPRLAFNGIPVEVPIERKSGMPYAGFINKSHIQRQITSIFNQEGVAGASPVSILGFDIEDDKGAVLRGRIRPSLGIIRNTEIDLLIEGDDLRAEKTFSGGELNLGGPFRVTNSDLTVSIGTRSGFRVLGGAAFEIQRLGQGRLEGQAGTRDGFRVAGDFQFDRRLFDADASVRLAYARGPAAPEGKLSGGGTVSIGEGRVRGLRGATVQANFDGENRSIQGSAELDIPGVESASLGVQFTPEGGTTISGNARFRDRPGMRNGHIEATLTEASGGWSLAASGGAEATFAGLTAQLEASYRNGLFLFAADAPYNLGDRVSGHVRLGLTNGQVNDEGRLLDTPPTPGSGTGGELRPFGNGTVNVRLTDWLQGGVGLRVRPNGDILINGRIGIPQPVTVFDQYPSPERARRTLFSMPTVSVPLVGLSVGGSTVGLALTINGRVTGHAQVGPGRLTQTELQVEDFNPAQPESLHVTGGATFDLAAEAGVEASLDAGVTLGAAVIRATAGLNVGAEAALAAHVTPHVDVDWRPNAGLHLHADLNASLSPRLAFNLNGYAEVVADAFVTSFTLWRKDWNLARREIGSNLGLNLAVPVDYYSDGRGVVFDPNAVRFDVPSLNADTLGQLLNSEGGSERAQRGEGGEG